MGITLDVCILAPAGQVARQEPVPEVEVGEGAFRGMAVKIEAPQTTINR